MNPIMPYNPQRQHGLTHIYQVHFTLGILKIPVFIINLMLLRMSIIIPIFTNTILQDLSNLPTHDAPISIGKLQQQKYINLVNSSNSLKMTN